MTGGVEGRDKDRANGWLRTLESGGEMSYRYRIEVLSDKAAVKRLLSLNV
jgi:hypothetical protein